MARITVEDCVIKIPNRFKLVLLASQRAREISAGAPLSVERDNDKNPVVALREIAEETVDREKLYDSLVTSLQKHAETDEPDEDELDLLSVEEELTGISVDAGVELAATDAEPMAEEDIAKDLLAAEEPEGTIDDLAKELLAEESKSLPGDAEGAEESKSLPGDAEGADESEGEDKGEV